MHHCSTATMKIWFASWRGDGTRRTKAIILPSGENTHASGRGAEALSVRNVRRVVEACDVDYEAVVLDWYEFRELLLAFFKA